jgi:hypothetical protein
MRMRKRGFKTSELLVRLCARWWHIVGVTIYIRWHSSPVG